MAKNFFSVGLRDLFIFPLAGETDTAAPTYDAALDVPTLSTANATPSTTNATADGDDKQIANLTMTTGWSIELAIWGLPTETEAKIYGHAISDDGQIEEKMSDIAPYCGVAYLRTIVDNTNTRTFHAYFYHKVQAVQAEESSTTSGSSLTLNATNVTFNAVEPSYGPVRSHEAFETEAAAIAWIKKIAGQTS